MWYLWHYKPSPPLFPCGWLQRRSDWCGTRGWYRSVWLEPPSWSLMPWAPVRSPRERRFPLAPPGQSLPQPAHTPKRITKQFALMEAWISCSNRMSLVVSTLVFRSGRLLGKGRERWLRFFFFQLRVGWPGAGLMCLWACRVSTKIKSGSSFPPTELAEQGPAERQQGAPW